MSPKVSTPLVREEDNNLKGILIGLKKKKKI